jgi:serine/threonine protein kinase
VTGERIGDRYELGERLGSGGTASVWRARDVADGRPVAVKLLHLDRAESAEAVARFEREARLLEAVRSDHVVRLLSHGDHKGRPYMVFALVDGEDLRERLRREGPLPPVEATRIALAMATGLEDAHARRVVHRDLKPANVLLDGRGAVRIADFGIARMLEEPGLTQPGRVLGTGEYVSPEQALGRKVDGRSDIYALGVVLFEMLTGRPPFTGPGFADVAAQHVRAPVPFVGDVAPGIPASLASLVTRCLQKRPEERPANARLVRMELEAILASLEDDEYETGEHDAVPLAAAGGSPWQAEPDPIDDPWRMSSHHDDHDDADDELDAWQTASVPRVPPQPRAPEPRYLYEDDAVPPRPKSDAGATRWLAIIALGLALLAGAFIWNGLSDDDDASGTATDTAAADAATTADTAPDTTAAAEASTADAEEPVASRPLRLIRSASFDPDGDGVERDDLAPLAIDGLPDTKWESEPYRGGPDLELIKPGVGLVVELARPTEIDAVAVRSTRPGYTLSVYTSAEADSPTGLEDYTQVVTPREVLNPQVRLALRKPLKARYVLLWFTKLSPTAVNDRYGVEVNEVRVTGVPAGAAATTTGTDAEATGTDETATGEDDATATDDAGTVDTADGESTAP